MRNTHPNMPNIGNKKIETRKPIFVVGPARSGTTFISHQVASAFEIQCSPETNVIAILKRVLKNNRSATFHDFERDQHSYLLHGPHRTYSILFDESLRHQKIANYTRKFTDAIISMDSYADGLHILEQTPRNGENLALLRSIYPEALILLVARNPMETIKSKSKTPWGNGNPLALFSVWARPYNGAMQLARSYGLEGFRVVEYRRMADTDYKNSLFDWIVESGLPYRKNPETIVPRNYASSDWAEKHLKKSAQEFVKGNSTGWKPTEGYIHKIGQSVLDRFLEKLQTTPQRRRSVVEIVLRNLSKIRLGGQLR